jgi:biopolymer transport protein ExbD
MDMTPMVDVTFLLLIFFMVTAAFSLQKSLRLPASDPSQPSSQATSLEEIEADPQYVIVRIDQYNTFRVVAAAWEAEQEAPTKPDLLDKLRAAQSSGPVPLTHMLVMASEDASHERVVAALDAGTAVGMDDVRLITSPVEQ